MSATPRRAAAAVWAQPTGSSVSVPTRKTARSERMQTAFAAETNCCCVGRAFVTVVRVGFEPPQAATTTGTRSKQSAGRTSGERTAPRVERVLGQRREDLGQLGPAAFTLLGEDELIVDHHVELALLALDHLRTVLGPVDLGHETRGP